MSVESGRLGLVNGESTVRQWNISRQGNPVSGIASNTRSGTVRRPGVNDWSGSFNNYGGVPLKLPGDTFTFDGYTAPDSGTGGTAGDVWSGNAIVDSIAMTWNWASGEMLSYVTNFSGNGELTVGTDTHSDSTDPAIFIPCGTKIDYGASASETEWDNLVQAVLTITAANVAFANSSTVASGSCWTQRKAGPIDWTLAVTEQNNAGLPSAIDIEESERFRLWVDSSDYWELEWGIVGDFSGLDVNRESGAIIQRTVNISMDGHDGSSLGKIVLPGASTPWWPDDFPG